MSKKTWGRIAGAAWALLCGGSLLLWPEHARSIQMTFYSIAVVGGFLSQVLLYRRRKRFWWALGVPLVGHIFILAKIEKLFPFHSLDSGLLVAFGECLILLLAMILIFGVTKTNPLVPDASLPEAIKQNENGRAVNGYQQRPDHYCWYAKRRTDPGVGFGTGIGEPVNLLSMEDDNRSALLLDRVAAILHHLS